MVELSRREREVAGLVAEGLSNRGIASRLFVSERTAEYHLEQIRNKLGFHSRTEVAAWVQEQEQAGRGRIRAGNLPLQLTSFVGRGSELAELRPLLGRARLVTLTGAGGVGKTRLALQLASGLPWPDGAWFVDLAGIGDENLIWTALAQGVEVPEPPSDAVAEVVGSHLATRSSLVLLDNCEHLLSALAPVVADLLGRCKKVRVLATSREPLGVPGELTWPVPSLPLPDTAASHTVEQVARNEAVELFVDRARLARPSFVLEPVSAAAVAEITRRLDGIPLAIELAAARIRTMGPTEIQERLRDRFRLLTGGSRTSAPRQQTLRATLDWSYALLSTDERTVFNRLGVFAEGFSLKAAEEVCGDQAVPSERIWDLLSRLVEKSMVLREDRSDGSRYWLLETMRDFALERALQDMDLGELRARHANFFLELAEEAEPHLLGPEQAEWLDRVAQDESNIRTAHEWLQEQAPEVCLRLGAAIRWFWVRRGRFSEGLRLGVEALAVDPSPTVARGRLLTAVAHLELFKGDYESARAHVEESTQILRASEDLVGLAQALAWSAAVQMVGYSDPSRGLQLAQEAVQVASAAGDNRTLGEVLNDLGLAWLQSGDAHNATDALQEGVNRLRRSDDGWQTGKVLESLADATLACGDPKLAAALWAESLQMSSVLGPTGNVAWCLNGFARLATDLDPERAIRLAAGAAAIRLGEGWVLGRWEETSVESWLMSAKKAIGAKLAEAAWREGAAMRLDELLEYALAEPLLRPSTAGEGKE